MRGSQALRKAWPEIGQQPTAEEMEGKSLDVDIRDVTPRNTTEALPPAASEETLQAITDLLTPWIKTGRKTSSTVQRHLQTANS
jgi:hypothetical protein